MPTDTTAAITYCGPAPVPAELLSRWNLDPWLLLALAAAGLGWRLSAGSRSSPAERRALGAAGAVLLVAFVSPLCAASAALFSARAVHHVLLVAVAAPLLALAGVAGLEGRKTSPIGAPLLAATAVFYAWHLPPLYGAALANAAVYWTMQVSLLASATWFWAAALRSRTPPTALLAMVAGAASMGVLGALLTFAPQPLYAAHATAPLAYGLTALEDQRLAGLLMWVPAMLPYLAFAAVAVRRGAGAWARVDA